MVRVSTRKLFLFGKYSLALLLPKKWLSEIGAKRGESVTLEFDKARSRIVIRLSKPANDATPPISVNKDDAPDKEDWQPIPQL